MAALPPFHLHWDVLLILGTIAIGYRLLEIRFRPPTWHRLSFYGGWALLVITSSWPMHDLAEQSLYWIHMVNHMVLTLVAPPLLLLGFSRPMADRLLTRRVLVWLRPLARPAVAFAIFNFGLIATHWPDIVALSLRSEIAHFLIHAFLFASGLLMWMPIASPSPLLARIAPPMQLLYLFLNSILPIVPAGFLTFSEIPLYPAYGDASLAFGLTAVADQTLAGLIMKVVGTMIFWVVMAFIWFRWASEEKRWDRLEEDLRARL
ncbi:cytochrome c oxidase assembly factor CtaG [soil metagenome]